MHFLRRLPLLCLAALALAPAAQAATSAYAGGGPALRAVSGVRGFELSVGDHATHEFSRTPSFAWSPVAGAKGYEFELSTSRSFATNGVIWSDTLKSPAVAVPLSIPWITGEPYSLYAHVRATNAGVIGPWSAPYGFNMRWTAVPKPMQNQPGLLRWTPIAGATSYEVWLIEAGHRFGVTSNVADEREYYTFHHGLDWSGVVHWRVRAQRHLYGSTANSLPADSSGPWSPVYTSYNPPFQVGPLTLGSAVSDTVSSGAKNVLHQLMPGFTFTGNRSGFNGATAELFRVYVFTDRDCLNVVYTGAAVGSPAYAPRPTGPLGLPQSSEALAQARSGYLTTGGQGSVFSFDGDPITSSEVASGTGTGSGGSTGGTGDGSTKSGGTNGSGSSEPSSVIVPGAQTDLWDDDWSTGGYYWTVMPVTMVSEDAKVTTLALPAAKDATAIVVADAKDIVSGDVLSIGSGATPEVATVATVDGNTVTLETTLKSAHGTGERVLQISGGIKYYDSELTQDACASGRIQTFAKTSTPAVTSGRAPFATGLSPTRGRLVAAAKSRPVFYGSPLVAWQPADGAVGYEVQWSRTKYPWRPAGSAQTFATASLLDKLTPGTWYYRVRGFDPYIPGAHTEMTWSSVTSLTVAKPTFKIVSG